MAINIQNLQKNPQRLRAMINGSKATYISGRLVNKTKNNQLIFELWGGLRALRVNNVIPNLHVTNANTYRLATVFLSSINCTYSKENATYSLLDDSIEPIVNNPNIYDSMAFEHIESIKFFSPIDSSFKYQNDPFYKLDEPLSSQEQTRIMNIRRANKKAFNPIALASTIASVSRSSNLKIEQLKSHK